MSGQKKLYYEKNNHQNYLLLIIIIVIISSLLTIKHAVGSVLLLAAAAIVFLNPHFGMLYIVFYKFLEQGFVFPIYFFASTVLPILLVTVFSLLSLYIFQKKRELFFPRQLVFLSGFLIIGTISSALNGTGMAGVFYVISQIFLVLVILFSATKKQHVANLFLLLGIVALFVFLFHLSEGKGLSVFSESIPGIKNRNDLAGLAAFIAPLAVAMAIRQKILKHDNEAFFFELGKKVFFIGIVIITAVITITSLSRSALLGIVTGIGTMFLKHPWQKTWVWLGIALLVMGAFFYPFAIKISERFGEIENLSSTEKEGEISSFQSRITAAVGAFAIFLSNPIIGIGLGNASPALGIFFPEQISGRVEKNSLDPHNIYLEILAETGILGFVFYLLFLAQTFFDGIKAKDLFRQKNDFDGALIVDGIHAAFVSALFMGLFFNDPFSLPIIFAAAAIISMKKIASEKTGK